MNKSESKYFNTARIMDNALVDLLGKKDFSYITVKELCEKAGVNRSTFYLHYESMNDLLEETLEMTNELFEKSFSISFEEIATDIESAQLSNLIFINIEYLKPYLEFMKANKKVYMAAQVNPQCMQTYTKFSKICENILIPIYRRFGVPEKEHEYWISFYIQGMRSIINKWIENDCRESVEEMIEIIINCVRPNFSNPIENK